MEKEKFQIEFPINSSKGVLYNCMSTPSGLSEWFCDDVNIKKDVHTFIWDGSEEVARLVTKKKDEYVKFKWMESEEDDNDGTYFELRIRVDEMTGERAIIVTDFAEEDDIEDARELWVAQLDRLRRVLGG
ncbi:MAG: SRPBCC domain-containing protein [Flavobacteriales bacterium]|nr:SRPBCC domain-containing protein [Flavobacteriales bacterium]